MQKTNTGDWIFTFPVLASYWNVEKKARQPEREMMTVKVTNYGSEYRVEHVGRQTK
jgi:hypothetical protein